MNPKKEVLQVPVEDLIPNRYQPRLDFDEKALDELSKSIKEHGVIQPLIVRQVGDKYEIIAGERRYKASTMAGLERVPVVVENYDDKTSAEVALVENVQRKDLTAIEEAKSYKNLIDKNGLTQEEVAKKMGLSQSAVANKLRLLNLSDEVQDALHKNKISERHARALLQVDDKLEQTKWLSRILSERLTVRQLDTLLKEKAKESEKEDNNMDFGRDMSSNNTNSNNHKENKFFKILDDEPVNMSVSEPSNNDAFNNSNFNTTNNSVFEDIEVLDITPEVEKANEKAEKIISSSSDFDISDTITKIREFVEGLSSDNINIDEIDLNDKYQINITIKK